ncbi:MULTISPECIES: VanZ family protein [unclassified Streptomyces]|uniref:VanZ family protein n=1 Tax=unclassified Streptomyces TaxID=2593676 RepID=UPI0038275909
MRQGPGGSAVFHFRRAGFLLLLLHLSLVAWVTLRPLDVLWVNAANLTPFAGIRADLALGPLEAVRRIGEGLLLLAPAGVLLPMVDGRIAVSFWASLTRTVTAGALLSLGIEMAQTVVPGRVVDVDSLLLNTAGVALAHLAVVPACRARLRREGRVRRSRTVRRGPSSPRTAGRRSSAGETALRETTLRETELRKSAAGEGVLREENPQGVTPTIPRVGIAP